MAALTKNASERHVGVDRGQGSALADRALSHGYVSCLYNAAVEIEVVRHDSGAQNTHRYQHHFLVVQELRRRDKRVPQDRPGIGLSKPYLDRKTHENYRRQGKHHEFHHPHTFASECQQQQHV